MATAGYLDGRSKWARPQGMLWANNSGTITSNGAMNIYVPLGEELYSAAGAGANYFMILSDHNRQPFDIKPIRIQNRKRMINGRMRSYYIADKLQISVSWTMLPSRAFPSDASFDVSGISPNSALAYTVDQGAGGVELLDWYENHTGSFWVYLSYDNYENFGTVDGNQKSRLGQYSQIIEMYITDFNYSVEKRGGTNYDMWNINVTLEEV